MKTPLFKPLVCLASGLMLAACTHAPDTTTNSESSATTSTSPVSVAYPDTRQVAHTDTYHGVEVADPYRWLEQQDTAEVKRWVDQQNQLSLPYLQALPTRDKYKERLTALWDFEKYRAPFAINGTLFYSYNDGLQNQYVLWMKKDDSTQAQVLIDPNAFSEDGTVSMGSFEVSPQASFVAYTKSDGGSDWKSIHVRKVANSTDTRDVIEGVKFTNIAWMPDESGFFYSRYPKNDAGEWDDSQAVAVYFHRLGTPQGSDKHIIAFADEPTWNPYADVINNGDTLLINIFERYSENAIFTLPVSEGMSEQTDKKVTPLFNQWDGLYRYVGEKDGDLYFTTTADAPTGKVIKTSLSTRQATTVVPAKKETLRSASLFGETIIGNYLKDVKSMVNVYGLDGSKVRQVKLDSIGNVQGFKGSKDSPYTYYKLTSFTNPGAVYRYDVSTGESSLFKDISTGVDYSQYQVKQVFYTSKDGTQVPMFIIHRNDVKLDGHNKTLLYGYGGFNVSLTPSYSVSRMVWLEQGNVLAIANLRGGGEYGQQWHKAGTKLDKQNVFDDFIAAAEYLIDSDYTQPEHLAVQGGSNGGLLVGAVLTQRPDLFGAALPAVGVLDMLRYHTPSANARGWSSDYGLSENQDEFTALYAYSPLHNTQQGVCYPATLVTTGDHDDRVVPWHSYKFAAQLQAHQGCDNPVLLRVETRAGHGAGTPTWMRIEGYADQWAFLEAALK